MRSVAKEASGVGVAGPRPNEDGVADGGPVAIRHGIGMSAYISPAMYSNRLSTFALASAWSCLRRTGPTSLYTPFSGASRANSCRPRCHKKEGSAEARAERKLVGGEGQRIATVWN
jgi:hypothetical protein